MHRVEAIWLKIVGVLLILLGLALFISPYVSYTTREEIGHTGFKLKREKTLHIAKPVAGLIIAAGITVLALASRTPRP